MSVAHEKTIGSKGHGLWGMKGAQLPALMQHVYNDLVQGGKPTGGRTYALAIGIVKNWARGSTGKGGKVKPDTVAKAAAAVVEWEKLKAKAHATREGLSTISDFDLIFQLAERDLLRIQAQIGGRAALAEMLAEDAMQPLWVGARVLAVAEDLSLGKAGVVVAEGVAESGAFVYDVQWDDGETQTACRQWALRNVSVSEGLTEDWSEAARKAAAEARRRGHLNAFEQTVKKSGHSFDVGSFSVHVAPDGKAHVKDGSGQTLGHFANANEAQREAQRKMLKRTSKKPGVPNPWEGFARLGMSREEAEALTRDVRALLAMVEACSGPLRPAEPWEALSEATRQPRYRTGKFTDKMRGATKKTRTHADMMDEVKSAGHAGGGDNKAWGKSMSCIEAAADRPLFEECWSSVGGASTAVCLRRARVLYEERGGEWEDEEVEETWSAAARQASIIARRSGAHDVAKHDKWAGGLMKSPVEPTLLHPDDRKALLGLGRHASVTLSNGVEIHRGAGNDYHVGSLTDRVAFGRDFGAGGHEGVDDAAAGAMRLGSFKAGKRAKHGFQKPPPPPFPTRMNPVF